jgi:hypothetical protein
MSVDGVRLQEEPPDKGALDQGEELESVAKSDAISFLPPPFFLTHLCAYLPHLSLLQLLAILPRLAMANVIADTILDKAASC